MKNRKTVIVAFLLVAALLLGVGYAAVTDTLTINGNAHIDIDKASADYDANVYFSNAVVGTGTGTGTEADVAAFSGDDATYTAKKLAQKDEKSVFIFTITNDNDHPVQITIADKKLSSVDNPSNTNPTMFAVAYEYEHDDKVIPANSTMNVTVTVTVLDHVLQESSGSFGIELTATGIDG